MGLGSFIYKNRTVQQHKDIQSHLVSLFTSVVPARILEIGTSYGGLTVLIRDTLNDLDLESTDLYTYDITDKPNNLHELNSIPGIKFQQKNIFDYFDSGRRYELNCNEAREYIQSSGPTIIFVDGGNKQAEFTGIAKHMKTGDIVLGHDYISTEEIFHEQYEGKIWGWCELTEAMIEPACSENNLIPFMQEGFNNVVWACRKKAL